MNNSLVSILIPVFNRENLVGKTIESAINQSYANIEIIIVDNCSTDSTWELLQSYAVKDNRIRIFKNTKNIGPVLNWKRCIDEAKGEYSKILFSDDLISANFVYEAIKLFDEKTAFVLAEIKLIGNGALKTLGSYTSEKYYSTKEYLNDILLLNNLGFPVSPGAALFRTKDLSYSLELEIDNPMNLDYKIYGAGNDLLLFLNTVVMYKTIKTTNHAKAFFRAHKESFTISNQLGKYYDFSKLYFMKKHLPNSIAKYQALMWLRMKLKNTENPVYHLVGKNLIWYDVFTTIFIIVFNKTILKQKVKSAYKLLGRWLYKY